LFREVFVNELKKEKPHSQPQNAWVADCAYIAKLAEQERNKHFKGVEDE
jgi:hypothetical protein